jgi:hypothetical protein
VRRQQTSLPPSHVTLARRLSGLPLLEQAVADGRVCVATAERVAAALAKLRPLVDRPDGLIDGQPGEPVVTAVLAHVADLVGEAAGGLDDDDPRLSELVAELSEISCWPVSQHSRLEAGFVLLAAHVESAQLPPALARLVDALLPNELERRAEGGERARGLRLYRKDDGSGWLISKGELDLECGELLHTVLTAATSTDPDNPDDTDGYRRARHSGWQPGDELPAEGLRTADQRRHDALRSALRALLDSRALGRRDKVAPHLSVTVGLDALHDAPGALPAVAASGARLPRSLVRRWLCDSALTRFVLSLGHKVLETSHTERTLKAHERRAKHIETGGRCQVAGCTCGPGARLIPHHGRPWARTRRTSLRDTVLVCERDHHHLHSGHTLVLKDGRRLDQNGWLDECAA